MPAADSYHDAPNSRWPRRILLAVVAIALLTIVATVGTYYWYGSERDRRIAAIRAAGEPVTIGELSDARGALPTSEDATELWLRACRAAPSMRIQAEKASIPILGKGADIPAPGQPWPQMDATQAFLADYAEALASIHAAAAKGGQARFPHLLVAGPPQAPWAATINHDLLGDLRTCARLAILEANVRGHGRDARGTAESLCAALAASRAIEDEALPVIQMTRAGMCGGVIEALRDLLPTVEWTDDDLARIEQALDSFDFDSVVRQQLIGDRAFGLSMFDGMHQGSVLRSLLFQGINGSDEIQFLDLMAGMIAASERPWPEFRTTSSAAMQKIASQSRWRNVMTRLTTSTIERELDSLAYAETKRRLAVAAVTLERYRRRTGRPAVTIDALVPDYADEFPVDLETGEPLTYRVSSDGYVIFVRPKPGALGARQAIDSETGADADLVFRYPAAVPSPQPSPNDEPSAPTP